MLEEIITRITVQPYAELKTIVSQILGQDAAPDSPLEVRKIGRSAGDATAGVFHVSGLARTAIGKARWSAVVKALGEPEIKREVAAYDAYLEVTVYRDRAFAEICGGVRSPHCYAIQQHPQLLFLWLEDLSHAPQAPWEAHHYIAAARHLGQFNAHWPADALPEWSWLSRCSFRNEFTQNPRMQTYFPHLPALQDHPLIQVFAPGAEVNALLQAWEECDALLQQAERGPVGICHLDCHPKNLFPIISSHDESYTVAIDWVRVGISNLGIDLGHLLASPLTWLEITPEDAAAVRDEIWEAYLAGLSDAGWKGNTDGVRLTYLTRLACEQLRNTNLIVHAVQDARWATAVERLVGDSLPEIGARYRTTREFYRRCQDEAQQLVARVH